MYLLTSRVHRKVAKRAAKKSPGKVPVSWDASGFELDGTLICPVIMAGEGTSAQSKLAPAPSIVGWLIVTRDDKKYDVDAQTLKIGLDQLLKILDLIPTDATCDEDSAFMKAMRELYPDLQFYRDWVHKGRHAEEYTLRDCKDKKNLTDAEQLHVSKAKDLWTSYRKSGSMAEAISKQAPILAQFNEGSQTHHFFEKIVFNKDPTEYCDFGSAHLPHTFDHQQLIESLFQKVRLLNVATITIVYASYIDNISLCVEWISVHINRISVCIDRISAHINKISVCINRVSAHIDPVSVYIDKPMCTWIRSVCISIRSVCVLIGSVHVHPNCHTICFSIASSLLNLKLSYVNNPLCLQPSLAQVTLSPR